MGLTFIFGDYLTSNMMDLPIHMNIINMVLFILYLISKFRYWSLKIVLSLKSADIADPDEMQHNAAFHQDLHCLPKYLFTGIQNKKG